jgi:hypothetical protein
MEIQANKLDGVTLFGSADRKYFPFKIAYMVISRTNEDNSYTVVYKSEQHKSTLNPKFSKVSIKLQKLCNSDKNRPIRIEFFSHDWLGFSGDTLIGYVDTNVEKLENVENNKFNVINDKKKKKNNYKNSGVLEILHIESIKEESFLGNQTYKTRLYKRWP